MRKFVTVVLKSAAIIVCVAMLLWCILAVYVYSHKKQVLQQITAQLNDNISGRLTIKSMEPALIRGFPGISVSLNQVSLEDSLYPIHHRKLLDARQVFVSVDILSVAGGQPKVRKLSIEDSRVHIYTDSNGYSNTHIFRNNDTGGKSKARIGKLDFENVDFVFENEAKKKLFHLLINSADANVRYDPGSWIAKLNTDLRVLSCTFNADKGSFLKNKRIRTSLTLNYDKQKQTLVMEEQPIRIDNDQVLAALRFNFAAQPAAFSISIKAKDIRLKQAASMLSPNIAAKINLISLTRPITATALIAGHIRFRDTPLVNVRWTVNNNELILPQGNIENCSFNGSFINEKVKGRGHNDPNSMITVQGFQGSWEDIAFRVDTLRVSNLISPLLEGRFRSQFAMTRLNPIIGGRSFRFQGGNASLDLLYRGGISQKDTNKAYVYGTIRATGVGMSYLPRNLTFHKSRATVVFRGRDIFINDVQLQQGSSLLTMNGSMKNFLSLYYTDPSKMMVDWSINSKQINLQDFTAFLGKRKESIEEPEHERKRSGASVQRISSQMDKLLAESNVRLRVQVDQLRYKTFQAANIAADVLLGTNVIRLDRFQVHHAGGDLQLNGVVTQRGNINDIALKADISNVDVNSFFTSFNNFGQSALTNQNIRGRLFASAAMHGSMTDNGGIVPYSLSGNIHFDLQDGALVKFAPVQKIGKIIFRNRDVENIQIRKLENQISIAGDKAIIPSMYIESSVLNIRVAGTYGFRGGTEIDIDVPLRNPKKDELIVDDSLRQERGMKGIVVHLKAVDGPDGNVKIKLRGRKD